MHEQQGPEQQEVAKSQADAKEQKAPQEQQAAAGPPATTALAEGGASAVAPVQPDIGPNSDDSPAAEAKDKGDAIFEATSASSSAPDAGDSKDGAVASTGSKTPAAAEKGTAQ